MVGEGVVVFVLLAEEGARRDGQLGLEIAPRALPLVDGEQLPGSASDVHLLKNDRAEAIVPGDGEAAPGVVVGDGQGQAPAGTRGGNILGGIGLGAETPYL
jgi:hypothetical protein